MSAPKGTARWFERGDDCMTAAYIESRIDALYDEVKAIIYETVNQVEGIREHAMMQGKAREAEKSVDEEISITAYRVVDLIYDGAYEDWEAAS